MLCMYVLTLLSIADAVLVRRLLSLELSEFIVSLYCRYRACNVAILSSVAAVEFLIFSIATDGGFLIASKIFPFDASLGVMGACGLSILCVPGTTSKKNKLWIIVLINCCCCAVD